MRNQNFAGRCTLSEALEESAIHGFPERVAEIWRGGMPLQRLDEVEAQLVNFRCEARGTPRARSGHWVSRISPHSPERAG
jgi:hypothetical protein